MDILMSLLVICRKHTAWQMFHAGISQDELYQVTDDVIVRQVLHDLTYQPIIKAGGWEVGEKWWDVGG